MNRHEQQRVTGHHPVVIERESFQLLAQAIRSERPRTIAVCAGEDAGPEARGQGAVRPHRQRVALDVEQAKYGKRARPDADHR
ncbi:hypothetical protein G6F22_018403 [Rhizopus arrhizus]|nr:hypothetical protein G6F22_018403 [Rhizopus arrhizus]